MPFARVTFVRAVFLVAGLSLVALGCPPPPDGNDTGPKQDGGKMDTSEDKQDTSVECTKGDAGKSCGNRGVCENNECVCKTSEDCGGETPACDTNDNVCVECTADENCLVGQICNTETFECEQGPCAANGVGSTCDPDDDDIDFGWKCIDAGKGHKCMKSCTQREDGSATACGASQACLRVDASDNAETVCYPSQCNGPGDDARCSGISKHPLFGEYSDGAKCVNYTRENCGTAALCVPTGSQKEGEKCNVRTPADCSESSSSCWACEGGNTCLGGRCRGVCSGDDECSGDETCVGLDNSDIVGSGSGFCAKSCNPYNGNDECTASGQGCRELTDSLGYCGDVGNKGYMESCQPPASDAPTRYECGEGLVCQQVFRGQSNQEFRCIPRCAAAPAGDDETRDNNATCGGTFYGRVLHAHDSPSEIDLYTNNSRRIDDLAAGAIGAGMNAATPDYFEVDVGALNRGNIQVDVTEGTATDASNPKLSTNVTASGGLIHTWMLHWDGQLALTPIPGRRGVEKPAMNSGIARVRAANVVSDFKSQGNPVNIDVVAVPDTGSLSSDAVELAEDLGSSSTGRSFAELQDGTYTIYAFPETADHTDGNQIETVSGINIAERARTTLVLNGTFDGSDSVAVKVTKIPYASAPNARRFRCIGGGLCFNECRNSEYGTNWCHPNAKCGPLQGSTPPSFCLPDGGNKAPGDTCNPSTLYPPCEEGATCVPNGGGQGRCRSLCLGGTDDSNPIFQCETGTTCSAGEGFLNGCRVTCSGGDNLKDPNCPANSKACIPRLAGEGDMKQSFCASSGSKSKGQRCGGSHGAGARGAGLTQNCKPGTICAHDSGGQESFRFALQGMFLHRGQYGTGVCPASVRDPMPPRPTCRQTCKPFADDPGCPDGEGCGVDLLHGTPLVGVCLKEGENIPNPATGTKCGQKDSNAGKLCGDASYCLPRQAGGGIIRRCFQFCDSTLEDADAACEGDPKCEEVRGLGAGLGLCR